MQRTRWASFSGVCRPPLSISELSEPCKSTTSCSKFAFNTHPLGQLERLRRRGRRLGGRLNQHRVLHIESDAPLPQLQAKEEVQAKRVGRQQDSSITGCSIAFKQSCHPAAADKESDHPPVPARHPPPRHSCSCPPECERPTTPQQEWAPELPPVSRRPLPAGMKGAERTKLCCCSKCKALVAGNRLQRCRRLGAALDLHGEAAGETKSCRLQACQLPGSPHR